MALAPCCCELCLSRTQFGQSAYKSYFASAMATMMKTYEAEVEPVKKLLFAEALREAAAGTAAAAPSASGDGSNTKAAATRSLDVLDLGCGALPNARPLLGNNAGGSSSSSPSSQSPIIAIRSLVGVDSNAIMFKFSEQAAREAGFEVTSGSRRSNGKEKASMLTSAPPPSSSPKPTARFVQASAALPSSLSSSGIPDESVDLVLCTLLLCSVPDPAKTIAAAAAALRPGGVIAFVEHTFDPDPTHRLMRATQRLLNPLQQLLADGCHLTRDLVPLFEQRGGGEGGGEREAAAAAAAFKSRSFFCGRGSLHRAARRWDRSEIVNYGGRGHTSTREREREGGRAKTERGGGISFFVFVDVFFSPRLSPLHFFPPLESFFSLLTSTSLPSLPLSLPPPLPRIARAGEQAETQGLTSLLFLCSRFREETTSNKKTRPIDASDRTEGDGDEEEEEPATEEKQTNLCVS